MRISASIGSLLPLLWRGSVSCFVLAMVLSAQAQNLPLNVQGRVTVGGVAFDGTGRFKFALFAGGVSRWSNDGTGSGGASEPANSVQIDVRRGLYSVLLGDPLVPGMTVPVPPTIFTNADVRLRVWFNDGAHGFQQLLPDQRLAAVGYALRSVRSDEAAVLTGNVTIEQVPSLLVTNNEANVTLTGQFVGDGSLLSGIRGSTPFQIATNGTNVMFPNTGYLATNVTETVFLLPLTTDLRVGDLLRVGAGDPGPWKIAQRDGQSIYAGHFSGGVGAKWVAREANRNWRSISSSYDGNNLIAVGSAMTPSIYVSTNAGLTWIAPALPPAKDWTAVAISGDGGRAVAVPAHATLSYVFISPDGGKTWSQRTTPGSRAWAAVATSATGTNIVAVAPSAAWLSFDGGETWLQNVALPALTWKAAAMSADGQKQAIAADKIYVSKNAGTNWAVLGSPTGNFVAVAMSRDGERIVAASAAGQIVTSVDGGTNWVARAGAGTRAWNAIACSGDGLKIAATVNAGQIYVSVDGGGGWTPRAQNAVWSGITMSSDAARLAATVFAEKIYTSESVPVRSTTPGPTGYLVGGEASAVELQHVGNGRFVPRSSAGEIFGY